MPQQDPALAIMEMHRSAHAALQQSQHSFATVHVPTAREISDEYADEGVLTYPDVPTAAQHYGISNKTLYGLIKSGQVREGVSFDYLTD